MKYISISTQKSDRDGETERVVKRENIGKSVNKIFDLPEDELVGVTLEGETGKK